MNFFVVARNDSQAGHCEQQRRRRRRGRTECQFVVRSSRLSEAHYSVETGGREEYHHPEIVLRQRPSK